MTVNIPDGFALVGVKTQLAGRPRQYVYTYGVRVDISPVPTAPALAAVIRPLWSGGAGTVWQASQYSSSYTFIGVHVLMRQGGLLLAGDSDAPLLGTGAITAATPNVSVLVKKRSVVAGRKGRGRFYLPPAHVSDTNIDQTGVMSSAQFTTLVTNVTNTLASHALANVPMYLLHSDTSLPYAVDTLSVDNIVATQRRRLR